MRMNAKWLTPVLWSVAIVGTAIAAACGDRSASRSLFSVLDSTGRDSLRDSVPHDTTPPPPPPPPGHAASLDAVPASQQVAVGDSGVVRAIVRDSAGREIQVSGITFTLRDTTIVQNISAGPDYRVFRASRVGRTLYDVRYNTLADTAVVIVVADSTPPPPPPPPDPVTRIIVSPKSQERVVGDSGVVSATLRDAAGRDVWPGEITWESSDTSTVLHIRSIGSSWIVFDALRSATARLIARHRDLADTAVVIVR